MQAEKLNRLALFVRRNKKENQKKEMGEKTRKDSEEEKKTRSDRKSPEVYGNLK